MTDVRKGQGSVQLTRAEFARRYREQFYDPTFEPLPAETERVVEHAWHVYDDYHKSPRTAPAGSGYADPSYALDRDGALQEEVRPLAARLAARARDVRTRPLDPQAGSGPREPRPR